jgi:two-component system, LytTR family, sensor kinase
MTQATLSDKKPLTLARLLQKPILGLLIGSLLGALLVYGSSGIIYFTSLIFNTKDPLLADLNRFIAWQNLTEGVSMFVLAWFMSDPLDRSLRRVWVRHLLFSVVAFLLFAVVSGVSFYVFGLPAVEASSRRPGADELDAAPWQAYAIAGTLVGNLFLYVLRQGRQLTRKMTEQEFQLINLEKLKNRAELDALQAKINPHFLYNALNSIASLVHENPAQAEEMTLLLSKLFRYSTGRDGGIFTTLADELDMVRTYLRVEQVRFGDRLRYAVEAYDPALDSLPIPQFLLQPLVENAIKHGIAKRADGGCIRVGIEQKMETGNPWLWLTVHDNGPAFADDLGGGYGLRSIQEKLRLLYADDARLDLRNVPEKAVCIGLKLTL